MKNQLSQIAFKSLAIGTCAVALMGSVTSAKAEGFSDVQKEELQSLFKDYLYENPEVILEAVERYRAEEEKRTQQEAADNLQKYKDQFANPDLPMIGNPDGDVTVVEFFDYNCGYCKKAYADIMKLVESDDNVRVVFQEMPILSPSSQAMAKMALAAHAQGKYFEMHQALMEYRGGQSEEAFMKLAEKLDLDMAKFKEDYASESVNNLIMKSLDLGRSLGIRGTPGFVIGDQVYPGYIGMDGFKEAIAQARSAE